MSSFLLSFNAASTVLQKEDIQNKLLDILNVSHFPVNNESHMRNRNELECKMLKLQLCYINSVVKTQWAGAPACTFQQAISECGIEI